ncbi:unnamed protein product [Caenorhabditis auriculariae]|uniref:Uncharacterized protein n=1 Tax=Caenorhabditis auriculariae TaxID=2777116 RepID=A0A8S1GUT2_9PELO|nr:unnamed protein product [Caenorhabditis auriculariae]
MEIMSQRKPPRVGRTKTGDLRLSTYPTALRWGDNVTNEALPSKQAGNPIKALVQPKISTHRSLFNMEFLKYLLALLVLIAVVSAQNPIFGDDDKEAAEELRRILREKGLIP